MKQIRILLAAAWAFALLAVAQGAGAASPGMDERTSAPGFVEIAATPALLGKLRRGGFVLYLRHGSTDNTRPDQVPLVDFDDCASQRPLTPEGRKMAARVGQAMRHAQIPVADVRVSPLCRTRETIGAAFPRLPYTVDPELVYTANLTDQQKMPIISNTRRLLSAPVRAGANRLLVAHGPNLMDLIGYFPKEGTLVVFEPKGEAGFAYIGSIPPALWTGLSR
jgi:phosphohistidine phosphatase SixA